MPYNLAEAEALTEKTVIVTYNLDKPDANGNLAIEVEGQIQAAAEMGIMLRPRGQGKGEMYYAAQIESIVPVLKYKEVAAKVLKPTTLDDARGHLADRHGMTLETVNALPPLAALTAHDGISHANLGHTHSE